MDHFDTALKRDRDALNGRFAHARRLNRGLDGAPFRQFLEQHVRPVVNAVGEVCDGDPEALRRVTGTLYDISLTLVGHDLVGPEGRYPIIARGWDSLLPALADHIVDEPYELCASLTNAIYNLAVAPGADAQRWLDLMLDSVEWLSERDDISRVGEVLAWRCGMAPYRKSAIASWCQLDDPLRCICLSLPTEGTDLTAVTQKLTDPWWRPTTKETSGVPTLDVVSTLGGFVGFGGPFHQPPEVSQVNGSLYASDGETCWSIHADCFGASLQRAGSSFPDGDTGQGALAIKDNGLVESPEQEASFSGLRSPLSWASNQSTLAVTTERTHKVILIARVRR